MAADAQTCLAGDTARRRKKGAKSLPTAAGATIMAALGFPKERLWEEQNEASPAAVAVGCRNPGAGSPRRRAEEIRSRRHRYRDQDRKHQSLQRACVGLW